MFNSFKIYFRLPPDTIANVFGWSRWNTEQKAKSVLQHKSEKDVVEPVTEYHNDSI